jgi:hypothetical protein
MTLAERKAERDYLAGQVKRHAAETGCLQCSVAKMPELRCDEWQELRRRHDEAAADVRTWHDPPEDAETGCLQCSVAKRPERRCDEWQELKRRHDEAAADVRTWHDPPEDAAMLFGPDSGGAA